MAFELPKPEVCEPFFRIRKPKVKKPSAEEKREKAEPGYLAKIRKLPCCVCDEPAPSHAHHLKCFDPNRGMGTKVPNRWTVPLCIECHIHGVEKIGSRQEAAWFRDRGILCLDLAAALYANSHSLESMLNVLEIHKDTAMAGKWKEILEFLKNGDELSEVSIVAKTKGLSLVQTPIVLAALEAKGHVKLRVLENRSRFYSITDRGKEVLRESRSG